MGRRLLLWNFAKRQGPDMKRVPTKLWLFVWLVGASLLLASCDSGSQSATSASPSPEAQSQGQPGESTSVKDLSVILSSGPTFKDLKATSVTVEIDTGIPVVCAAAFGTTTAYGQLATDSDMAGGAHSHHHPLLGGLQPDTEYHMRLQGVGSDGTLYRSKDYTFHTSQATQAQPGAVKPSGKNLALISAGARVVGVSSNFGGGDNNSNFGANHAFDGDPSTQWSSNSDGNKAWVEIELAVQSHITGIGFWTRTMGSSAQIRSFQVIADGGKVYGPFKLSDADAAHYFTTDFSAHKLRFEAVDTSGGNTGAVEIEVYGRP